ncbi:helix-turn-helix domain-containing protein [Micromonospora sp. NPDC005206]|uniref:TetR/AcrR family transcriptional regulator n=1 Tax=Micromonospora sp. NPDC005206 TaxID=3157022 RepID=UPI0033B05EC1
MAPDQRRETIIHAALPLVAERGAAVTTAQIARAAGIGEATIFRVFDDKDAVLEACVAAAMDPTHVLQQLNCISLDQPLADRLVEAIEALDAHFDRMGTVIGALHASGNPNRRPGRGTTNPARPPQRSTDRDAAQAATRQAILELLEPEQPRLRLPADTLTQLFLGLFFGRGRNLHQHPEIDIRQLVDLFLHGAYATGQTE